MEEELREAVEALQEYLHYQEQVFHGSEYGDQFAEYIHPQGLRKYLTITHLRTIAAAIAENRPEATETP